MLRVVPTPIGNLEDLSPRSLKALGSARAVLCEDTRRSLGLLSHYGVRVPVERYDERNPRHLERALERLRAGAELALVSDGGTPVISDPGLRLLARVREERLPATSLPGPCAAAAAVAGSGLPGDSFVFLGFLPRSASRRRRELAAAAALGRTLVLYESPFRVLDLMARAGETLGPGAQAAVVRELSKLYEEWFYGSIGEVESQLRARKELKGEFVAMFHPRAHG